MTLKEIIGSSAGIAIMLLTIIQIAPIKINPWSWLLRIFGNAINTDLKKDIQAVRDEVASLKTDLKNLQSTYDEDNAKRQRRHILTFADELSVGLNPTKEHFANILAEITKYELYCREHPEFLNHVTKSSAKFIIDTYNERLHTNNFHVYE